ncbi:Ku protein [Georgenia thermotolerans]|uniref:Non-homologous end joining protein Ku n=1 Tax=Georgenia thermotolerans TaxID=527326 RepID=A0A7J5ULW3_9MICO|nr:Ku protein [Georgenia thermotolerans]KAE8763270.1 Ku protein [Georgenia thermotolerans]
MRAIWKGSISFGLVNVPIKLFSATESHDVELHQVHNADGGRIRYQRRCEVCGKVIDYGDIAKAFDDGDRTVILTAEDFDALPVEKSREISVLEFVPSDQLDPIMFQKPYYLAPDSKSTKSYVLLRRTLEETDRTAIVNFTLREKTRLGALRVRGDVLVLQSLLWEDEVRQADFPELEQSVKLSSKEMEMAAALVSSFESDFNPDEFEDEYQVELRQLVQAKLEQGEAVDTEKTFGETGEEEGGEVLDLMEALRRSVEASRSRKSGGRRTGTDDEAPAEAPADEADEADEEKPARKSTGTRRPARKSAEEKATAAEKAPARKTAEKTSARQTAEKAPARKAPTRRSTATRASGEGAEEKPAAKKTTTRTKKAPAKKTA